MGTVGEARYIDFGALAHRLDGYPMALSLIGDVMNDLGFVFGAKEAWRVSDELHVWLDGLRTAETEPGPDTWEDFESYANVMVDTYAERLSLMSEGAWRADVYDNCFTVAPDDWWKKQD